MSTSKYHLDLADPRAPTEAEWAELSPVERERLVEQLPSELPRSVAPEGDRHRIPKERATQALSEFFRRMGRRVYLSAELPVYYPGERWFAPDLIAVLDVEPGEREKWVVSQEGKGLDLVLEITLSGNRRKDLIDNAERYARLGIPEYFVLDLGSRRIIGYRLEPGTQTYTSVVPQAGRWESRILGLDLVLEGGRIRFYAGTAPLLEADELIGRLSSMVDALVAEKEALEQRAQSAEAAAQSAEALAQSADERAQIAEERAARLAARLRELGEDPDA